MNRDSFPGVRAFARNMLHDDRVPLAPRFDLIRASVYAIETVLFRESCWQIELIAMFPNMPVPMHRHNRCDSCELVLAGSGLVEGHKSVNQYRRGSLAANLVRIGKGKWHGGAPGEHGAMYLSFQQWDGEPAFITEDFELCPQESR